METFRTVIHAQAETVWKLLLERIENPGKYNPAFLQTNVMRRTAEGIVRQSRTVDGYVQERISPELDENAIHTVLLEHPFCRGTVVVRLLPTSGQNPMAPLIVETQVRLEVREDYWGLHDPRRQMSKQLQEEMDRVKQAAEEREQES